MPFYKKKGWATKKRTYGKKKYGGTRRKYTKKTSSGNWKRKTYTRKPNYEAKAKSVVYKGTEEQNLLKTRIKMKWMMHANVSAVAQRTHTLDGQYQVRCNSIFDPNYNDIGESAAGWTMMRGLYNKYLVTAAKIEVQFTMNGLEPAHPNAQSELAFFLKLRTSPANQDVADTFESIMLNGNAVWKVFPAPTPEQSISHTLTGWYIPQRVYGPEADPATCDWDKYGSGFNGSPTPNGNPCLWQFGIWNTNNQALGGTVAVNAMVTVTYWPIFAEPVNTTQGLQTEEGMLAYGEKLIADGAKLLHDRKMKVKRDGDDDALDELTGKLEEQAIRSPTLRDMLGESSPVKVSMKK